MLEILRLIVKERDTDPDLVDLEEAEGYARDFALEVLERLGFDKETRERHVTELTNEMWLRQHPKHGDTASKPPAPKVPVEAIQLGIDSIEALGRHQTGPVAEHYFRCANELLSWLSAQEEGDK